LGSGISKPFSLAVFIHSSLTISISFNAACGVSPKALQFFKSVFGPKRNVLILPQKRKN